MLIPQVQLQVEKVTQINLVAHAIWKRIKKTRYSIGFNDEKGEVRAV